MTDKLTKTERSENMRRIRSKGMKPEMIVRRLVHSMGYRYRLHKKNLPGNPDLVFSSRKKIIFVHGCFWHQHDAESCRITRKPKSNKTYWLPKLQRNVERDKANQSSLKEIGWRIMIVWECEIGDLKNLTEKLKTFLEK